MNKKHNIFDYLDWRGDLSFLHSDLNEIDALIFSVFSHLNFSPLQKNETLTFEEMVNRIDLLPDEEKYNGISFIISSVVDLAKKASKTERFRHVKVCCFTDITDEEREIQFAAITFLLPDQTAFLAFRGTDNTLVGWKEDFNMSFMNGIPAQFEATQYAESVISKLNCPFFYLGGHSKGANLAVWAGAHLALEHKQHLLQIYNNDGPGFSEEFLITSHYLEIRDKIISFVPESSIVGVLMAHDDYITIKSSNTAIMQHDPFSWLLLGTHFLYEENRSLADIRLEKLINSWIESMTLEEREALIEKIYTILTSTNARTLDDLDKRKLHSLVHMLKTYREMSSKNQYQLLVNMIKLLKHNIKNPD